MHMVSVRKHSREALFALCFASLVCIAAFLCFYKLDRAAIANWDEARHGVNAYEMLQGGNPAVNTYAYAPDMYNLKPPLVTWAIALGYRLFGYNELGLRFFSALSLFCTILLIAVYTLKHYGKTASLCCLFISLCYSCLYFDHWGRSGDPDAIYILFFTLSMLSMSYIPQKPQALYAAGFFFSLAFLSKSFHALSIVAIGGLFLLLTGTFFRLRPRQWFLFLCSSFLPIFAWAAFRFVQPDGPAFFRQMIGYDLLRRSGEALEGHPGGLLYYVDFFRQKPDFFACICLCCYGLAQRTASSQPLSARAQTLLLWFTVTFLCISFPRTKISWYAYPAFLPLIIAASASLAALLRRLTFKTFWPNAALLLLCAALLLPNLSSNLQRVRSSRSDSMMQVFMKSALQDQAFRGRRLYRAGDWQQAELLQAELCMDARCEDGGIDRFLQSEAGALLLCEEEDITPALRTHTQLLTVMESCYLFERL